MNKVLTCVRLPWKGRMKFEIMLSFLLALLLETIMISLLFLSQNMLIYPSSQLCGEGHLGKPETVILHQYRSGDQSFIMHVFENLHVLMEILHPSTTSKLVSPGPYVHHHIRDILDDHLVFHHSRPEVEVFLTKASAVVAGLHEVALADNHRYVVHTATGLHHPVDAFIVERQHTAVHYIVGTTDEFRDHSPDHADFRMLVEHPHLFLKAVWQTDVVAVHTGDIVIAAVVTG